MSDNFSIIPFRKLVKLTLNQLDKGQFLGIPQELFFKPDKSDTFRFNQYGHLLETPIGVAAGPHTQLAQNIIAAWLTGARFIELKTVQTLDELEVSKPCIDMQDEGYNCEWSQELKIHQSFNQYLEAWILIHIIKDKLQFDGDDIGTIFNMSVGYDYAGIQNENVQWFFDKMADASDELQTKIEEIKDLYPNIKNLEIPAQISDNITLSTMHGCPPEEIEQIGEYLISERKLHTAIKLNPTLLGKKDLRAIIADSGFDTTVPDIAFEHDLKYEDAVPMIARLKERANKEGVSFGLKLTNTLESINHKDVFPENEEMMYASGRVLHPISINIARKLQNEFNGELAISFSGGATSQNIDKVIASGLFPTTVCSDILKPGGYGKLQEYINNIKAYYSGATLNRNEVNNKEFLQHLNSYADAVLDDKKYKKTLLRDKSIKTNRTLKAFDCVHAPCVDTCPTNQGIPDYMYHTAKGDFDKAFEVIQATNPFPNTTGMVCDHMCQTKCTRINYDSSLLIREIKRFVTENASNVTSKQENEKIGNFSQKSIAVIGAGPAGLSAARYLREAGFEVVVYEAKLRPGGMVQSAIPAFRITEATILADVKRIENLGVQIHYNTAVDKVLFKELQQKNDYIFIAGGAQKAKDAGLEGDNAEGVLNPLEFLYEAKQNTNLNIGKDVIIIGGGNTAMDAARTAKRLVGKGGCVKVVYRRTIKQMPADQDEITAVQNEGIDIMELVSPTQIIAKEGKLTHLACVKMKLGEKDNSGRRRPVVIEGSEFKLTADVVIPAFGQDVVFDFIDVNLLQTKEGSYESQVENVFVGGDALRGGSSIINAVGDGRKAAAEIIRKAGLNVKATNSLYKKEITTREIKIKKTKTHPSKAEYNAKDANENNFNIISVALTKEQAIEEASRCLYCDEICDVCTTVCPNLALYPYQINPVHYQLQKLITKDGNTSIKADKEYQITQKNQIIHIEDWCNECGNCNTFCPSAGAPYKEKPHLHFNKQAYQDAKVASYYYDDITPDTIFFKEADKEYSLTKKGNEYLYTSELFTVNLDVETFEIKAYQITNNNTEITLERAAEMSVILQAAKQL